MGQTGPSFQQQSFQQQSFQQQSFQPPTRNVVEKKACLPKSENLFAAPAPQLSAPIEYAPSPIKAQPIGTSSALASAARPSNDIGAFDQLRNSATLSIAPIDPRPLFDVSAFDSRHRE